MRGVILVLLFLIVAGCKAPTYCHPSMVQEDGGGIYFERDRDGGGNYFERDGGGRYVRRDGASSGVHQGICRRGVPAPPATVKRP